MVDCRITDEYIVTLVDVDEFETRVLNKDEVTSTDLAGRIVSVLIVDVIERDNEIGTVVIFNVEEWKTTSIECLVRVGLSLFLIGEKIGLTLTDGSGRFSVDDDTVVFFSVVGDAVIFPNREDLFSRTDCTTLLFLLVGLIVTILEVWNDLFIFTTCDKVLLIDTLVQEGVFNFDEGLVLLIFGEMVMFSKAKCMFILGEVNVLFAIVVEIVVLFTRKKLSVLISVCIVLFSVVIFCKIEILDCLSMYVVEKML